MHDQFITEMLILCRTVWFTYTEGNVESNTQGSLKNSTQECILADRMLNVHVHESKHLMEKQLPTSVDISATNDEYTML